MPIRRLAASLAALLLVAAAGLPAQTQTFPVDQLKPGMEAIGRTVFEGDRVEDFKVHILGVLRNVIGPRRNLILARLEGGPLAKTGVIAGMSGSPVYIDGRLVGAVSYSLGQFATEPIAGITPFDEMVDATTTPGPRRQTARVDLSTPLTPEGLRNSLRQAFSWFRPFADSPADVQVLGDPTLSASLGTLLRPIATPLAMGGFDPAVIDPIAGVFRDHGFVPMMAGAVQAATASARAEAPLRPGDPVGVDLMTGDLELGATGTITAIDGDRLYAFGHPFYGLGPTQFPMTRAYVEVVLPSLSDSMKITSTGGIIGTIQQDRATAIAGTLGVKPKLIPIHLKLISDHGSTREFSMEMVNDQLFTPLLAYMSILNTLQSYERQNGVASYEVKGAAIVKGHGELSFEDLFTGDQPSAAASAYVVAPLNLLLRNQFEDVQLEALNLEIDASEQARTATLERAWIDGARPKPGSTVNLKVLIRSYRGDEVTRSVPVQIPANARGSVSIMVSDGAHLSQVEARELQVQPLQARGLPQMISVLNNARKNNRLYVRLVTPDGGAVVKGEPLAALPPSVLAVMQSDRDGGSFRPLQSALVGQWEIPSDYAVSGVRTLTLPLSED
ncbi:MAG TPA: SpoIVB peptidase S55 domain-containing protein [Vicinamibacterales bacterium]|nr:SpoIVB peptidase S55 domain-containing protein [Vicinamibacterales bacterium]